MLQIIHKSIHAYTYKPIYKPKRFFRQKIHNTLQLFVRLFAATVGGEAIKCGVEWIGVSDWSSPTIATNSCIVFCGVEMKLLIPWKVVVNPIWCALISCPNIFKSYRNKYIFYSLYIFFESYRNKHIVS